MRASRKTTRTISPFSQELGSSARKKSPAVYPSALFAMCAAFPWLVELTTTAHRPCCPLVPRSRTVQDQRRGHQYSKRSAISSRLSDHSLLSMTSHGKLIGAANWSQCPFVTASSFQVATLGLRGPRLSRRHSQVVRALGQGAKAPEPRHASEGGCLRVT